MNGATAKNELVYQALKGDILNGAYPPDHHLDKEALRRKYGFSTTPTNFALIRLFNEGLLEKRGRDGFYTRRALQPTELKEIYLATGFVLKIAAEEFLTNCPNVPIKFNLNMDLDIVTRTEQVFESIACLQGQFAFHAIARANNDRLHLIRVKKAELFRDREEELGVLVRTLEARDLSTWAVLIDRYIARRIAALADLVRLADQTYRPL